MIRNGKNNWKQWIFVSTLCFVLLITVLTGLQGKKQDKEFLADYMNYQEALEHFYEGDYDQAYKIYEKLLRNPRYHNSIELNLQMARTEVEKHNHKEAIRYYEKIIRKYPAILLDNDFLDEYAWELFVEDDERYLKYFERLKTQVGEGESE